MPNTTSTHQDKEFISEMIGTDLLENAIQWITNKFTPEDLYGLKELIEFVKSSYDIEVVFGKSELEEWAEENGYIKD